MTTIPQVSLVIPVHNQVHYTEQCVTSIACWTDVPYELVIVDNASTDGTGEILSRLDAKVITNPSNLGCAKAWNQGILVSQGQVIGILNNDIVVTPGWLSGLLRFMDHKGHGIVSPAAREGRLDYDLEQYAADFVQRCAGASRATIYGSCMLIHRKVFDRIGLFDEGFSYGGCEDVDFLWRAQLSGFSVGTTGAVLIHHFGMVTQEAIKRMGQKYYPEANQSHFLTKWKRTVRGNWIHRRWDDLKTPCRDRYERVRYGHALVERFG
ncbi:MAG: glycosyltransferase family 2 protein [Candidatus Binatia bacterium]